MDGYSSQAFPLNLAVFEPFRTFPIRSKQQHVSKGEEHVEKSLLGGKLTSQRCVIVTFFSNFIAIFEQVLSL